MQEFAKILSNVEIAKDIWKMELKTDLAKTAKPGQFIEITVPGFYLRRPISISEIKEDILVIIYKVLGEGTLKMTELEGKLDIFGPLGNGFPIEDKEELIKRYYTSILRYCRWHCSNLEKAEDLTQETFLKLFKNLSGYKGKKKFKAYLYTIANHLCIDESRKVEFYPLEDEENIVHEYNDIVRLEDRAEISYFLNFLSSEQREAVILRFGEQLSFGEIAKVMGCNMRTAQSRVRNALKIMRKEQENER